MKLRVFTALFLAVGLVILLALAVAAQGAAVKGANEAIPDAVSAGHAISLDPVQDATSLDHTSEISFTPAFTTRLPAVFKGHATCATVPTLTSPVNGSNLNTLIPLFQWDSGDDPNATTLRLQVAKDSDFTEGRWSLRYGTATGMGQFRFSRNLDPATTYYWRAWLLCDDAEGPYSEVWSFTTGSGGTILPAPGLTAPANGSTLTSLPVTLQWSDVDGTVEYLVHRRKVGEGGYTYRWVTDTQTEVSGLEASTTYEWWVSARNDYAIGDDSETWQFTTPAESSSTSRPDPDRSFVIEDNGAIIVFEGQDSK